MAGYDINYIRLLIRQAKAQSDGTAAGAITFLTELQTAQFATEKNGCSTLTAATINGKSTNFSVPAGMTKTDAMTAVEVALQWLEAGLTPTTTTYARPV